MQHKAATYVEEALNNFAKTFCTVSNEAYRLLVGLFSIMAS